MPNLSKRKKDPVLAAFGDAIRRYREGKKLSQEQLALQAGIDRTYLGDIERGNNSVSLLHLVKIAHALDVSAGELLLIAGL